jgi:small nuclear ribonucleoprotein (snRNP)-like protein
VDAIGDQVLEKVNIMNQLNRAVSGSVEVVSPAGNTVLNDTFEVPSEESNDESNIVAYGDIWKDTGRYQISIKLPDTEIDGVGQVNETVLIENTEAERVAVVLGSTVENEPIAVRVGESLSDFGQTNQSG